MNIINKKSGRMLTETYSTIRDLVNVFYIELLSTTKANWKLYEIMPLKNKNAFFPILNSKKRLLGKSVIGLKKKKKMSQESSWKS